jgi:hypothetical protein
LLVVPCQVLAEGVAVVPAQDDSALAERVTERWRALIARDFASAYAFSSPSYRALFDYPHFARQFGKDVVWKSIQLGPIEHPGEGAAKVGVTIYFLTFTSPTADPYEMSTYIVESWVFAEDQWWYLPDQ